MAPVLKHRDKVGSRRHGGRCFVSAAIGLAVIIGKGSVMDKRGRQPDIGLTPTDRNYRWIARQLGPAIALIPRIARPEIQRYTAEKLKSDGALIIPPLSAS